MPDLSRPFPALCKDCRWSKSVKDSTWELRCTNAVVNADDAWALSNVEIPGTNCHRERERGYFAPCGKRGKRWEAKA